LLVKTPTRAVDRKLLVYTLVGENTNKGGIPTRAIQIEIISSPHRHSPYIICLSMVY
jgi:hypothetical protein